MNQVLILLVSTRFNRMFKRSPLIGGLLFFGLNWYDIGTMKLSWSHKLFFQANRLLGKSSVLDGMIKFWAEYAIFWLGSAVFISFWFTALSSADFLKMSSYTGLAILAGLVVSFTIAWIWPHHRPKVEFPEITELITPLSHWKSLPSDHSLVAWLLMLAYLWFTNFGLGINLVIIGSAQIICFSRVLAGVHYPRDIVAGASLAGIIALIFFR